MTAIRLLVIVAILSPPGRAVGQGTMLQGGVSKTDIGDVQQRATALAQDGRALADMGPTTCVCPGPQYEHGRCGAIMAPCQAAQLARREALKLVGQAITLAGWIQTAARRYDMIKQQAATARYPEQKKAAEAAAQGAAAQLQELKGKFDTAEPGARAAVANVKKVLQGKVDQNQPLSGDIAEDEPPPGSPLPPKPDVPPPGTTSPPGTLPPGRPPLQGGVPEEGPPGHPPLTSTAGDGGPGNGPDLRPDKGRGDKDGGCVEARRPRRAPDPERPLEVRWHYFYINGINTSRSGTSARGHYESEKKLVREKLIGSGDREPGVQHILAPVDTYNPSGTDPRSLPAGIECLRAGRWKGLPMSAGDMLESALQGLTVGQGANNGIGLQYSAKHAMVQRIAAYVERTVRSEKPGRLVNYFIVIAHSQGNFFAEGLAAELHGRDVNLERRLGVLGVASPTDYRAVPTLVKRTATRADDIILSLEHLARLGLARQPAPASLPPLVAGRSGLQAPLVSVPVQALGDSLRHCLDVLLGRSSLSTVADPFAIPYVNAHLLDNYLDWPRVTEPGVTAGPAVVDRLRAEVAMIRSGVKGLQNRPIIDPETLPFPPGGQFAPGAARFPNFGRLVAWSEGRTLADNLARTEELIAALPQRIGTLQQAGVTAAMAQRWADFYAWEAARTPTNPNARPRHLLMQAIADLLVACPDGSLPPDRGHRPGGNEYLRGMETALAECAGVQRDQLQALMRVPRLLVAGKFVEAQQALGITPGHSVAIDLLKQLAALLAQPVAGVTPFEAGRAAGRTYCGIIGLVARHRASTPPRGSKPGGRPSAQLPLRFGSSDLIYGPSAGGALRQLQQKAGGRLLTDVGGPAPGQSWIQFSRAVLEKQLANGGWIRFDLTHVENVAGLLVGQGPYAGTVTAAELRYLHDNWARFNSNVAFYRDGSEVPAPW